MGDAYCCGTIYWTKLPEAEEVVDYGFRVNENSEVFVEPPPPGLAPTKFIRSGGQIWEQTDNLTLIVSGASVLRKVPVQ